MLAHDATAIAIFDKYCFRRTYSADYFIAIFCVLHARRTDLYDSISTFNSFADHQIIIIIYQWLREIYTYIPFSIK